MTKQILLNAFNMNTAGHQSSGLWRHPRDRSREYTSIEHWQDLARTLERGLFDGVFLADVNGLYDVYGDSPDAALRNAVQVPANDPFSIVPVMAAATEHLCFGVTGSIPYEPPAAFARRMSTLDHLTKGRVGWNIVTGYLDSAAKAVGKQRQDNHDTRYEIAAEYVEVVYRLWEESWDDDAVVFDRDAGVFTDPSRVHRIRHDGVHFQLDAVHLCEPSPQRTPVLFQAGSSRAGQTFAARHAECVFIGSAGGEKAANLVASLRDQAEAAGRKRNDLKIFGMLCVVAAATDEEAEAKYADYISYALPEGSLALMAGFSGIDLSVYGLDDTAQSGSSQAIQSLMSSLGMHSMREWGERMAVGGAADVVIGSATTVADELQRRMNETDLDGFNLAYSVLPECFEDFVDLVVPELQQRGVYKTEYSAGTMRHKLFGQGDRTPSTHPSSRFRRPST
jgi:FMN-dependent oxidoreductase (nitrilotriacetate monooxygenase family)